MISLAMFQPDIPQNVGAMMRLAACMGVDLHIIEPCGFPWNPRKIQQAGMDYVDSADVQRHASWDAFTAYAADRRVILMTTKGAIDYCDFQFKDGDILLAGSESTGAPPHVHDHAEARIKIMMREGMRSLNIVNATSMILGETIRQVRYAG